MPSTRGPPAARMRPRSSSGGGLKHTARPHMPSSGSFVSQQEAEALRQQYGLDQPLYVQYLRWIGMVLQGNFGMALEYGRPVAEVIGDRLWLTMVGSVGAMLL